VDLQSVLTNAEACDDKNVGLTRRVTRRLTVTQVESL
jgi:hypothetical protein